MQRRPLFITTAIVILFVLPVLWFSAVDWCWYIDRCEGCHQTISVTQTRVFGHPISELLEVHGKRFDHRDDLASNDCVHPRKSRWLKVRLIGMLFCAPCHNGIVDLIKVETQSDDNLELVQD